MIMDQPSWENIWTVKAMLRGFELCSSLFVNFIKSRVIGFNVKQDFLLMPRTTYCVWLAPFISTFRVPLLFAIIGGVLLGIWFLRRSGIGWLLGKQNICVLVEGLSFLTSFLVLLLQSPESGYSRVYQDSTCILMEG
ncbi:hypothetical protein KIW84_054339 [Lathyrus oleraceus]|uniref:Uncharacterized protein n=1 Tax=Pisum sativum TaxID=3888 RepID=A0A9D4WU34_PEA|nr:hypothetical protein KIW84_054339 [Pisum sativum]